MDSLDLTEFVGLHDATGPLTSRPGYIDPLQAVLNFPLTTPWWSPEEIQRRQEVRRQRIRYYIIWQQNHQTVFDFPPEDYVQWGYTNPSQWMDEEY